MRNQYIKELLPYTCEPTIHEKHVIWKKNENGKRLEFPNLHKKIEELSTSENPIDSVTVSDLKMLQCVYSILNFQSEETLRMKSESLPQLNRNYYRNLIPDDLCEESCLKWAREPYWSYNQAALLSLGISPNTIIEYDLNDIKQLTGFHSWSLIDTYRERLLLIKKHSYISNLNEATPFTYLKWFKRMEFSFPRNLENVILRLNGEAELDARNTESLSALERTSLLKLIAAMSIKGYRFDPFAQRNQATSDIQSDLELCGIPLDPKTILKWLREAAEMVDTDVLN